MSEISNKLSSLSPRGLQIYASKFLQAYCNAKSFQHLAINDFIAHLNNYPENDNLDEWERRGGCCHLMEGAIVYHQTLINRFHHMILSIFARLWIARSRSG
ncbi:hypothetical protein PS925_02142 [Pseudomonas fluorescens]|uniref:Uncharacterized protein n=1 Tax=Pseudomonas fluorescens TaxID=294 RepID=A0A5E7TM25_PSEFL|nr:hypothetical protein PS925_02142 [Pseudomonas fluorescens]